MTSPHDTQLLYDWPYAERLLFATLSSKLIESHGKAHLWRALNSGRAIAVVGSGTALAYGRPTWSGILENMRLWIMDQYKENLNNLDQTPNTFEAKMAYEAFKENGLEVPVRPGLQDYTTVFQVMENLYVAMEEMVLKAEADGKGRLPEPGMTFRAKQRFRTHFRHHFKDHVKRCLSMNERLARVMYPDQDTPNNAAKSFRRDVLTIYRARMTQIEQTYIDDDKEKKEKTERLIRDLLAPHWMFDNTLDKDEFDDEAKGIGPENVKDFLFGVELALMLKEEIAKRLRNRASSVSRKEQKFLEKLGGRLDQCELGTFFPKNSTAMRQEGLWFLSEVLVSLVGATSHKIYKSTSRLNDQSAERWKDPTTIYKHSPSREVDDENPLFHILQQRAYQIANATDPANDHPPISSAQRTILSRDPLSVLFRELNITRFLTTNYDLEIESMFEHHGFRLQRLQQEESEDTDNIDRQVYTNVTGERATSFDYRSENAASMIDFSLDERADISHVVHLHGSARPGVELAVTEDDYKSFHVTEHSRRDAGRSAMDLAFTSNPLVFVGLGMDEPDILRPLRAFSTETGDLSERPAIAILARTGRMADCLFDKPTDKLGDSVRNEISQRSANLLAKWGVMSVFYGTAQMAHPDTEGDPDDEVALARILFHLSRISRDKNLERLARLATEKSDEDMGKLFPSDDDSKFAKELSKFLQTDGVLTPLADALGKFDADHVTAIEGQPLDNVKFDIERAVSRWPEKEFFPYLVKKIQSSGIDPPNARNVCYFVRAYRELCIGLEQNIQTVFLTAFLNRCAIERSEWLSRWTRFPPARRTIVNEPRAWTRSET